MATTTIGRVSHAIRTLQFGDSVFPVGAFSFSNGLESAVGFDMVHDLDSLWQFMRTATHLAATGEGIAVLEAYRATHNGDLERLARADQAVYLRTLNDEVRTMTTRMGNKLTQAASHVVPDSLLADHARRITERSVPGTYPPALGAVFAALGLSEPDAFAAHQYGTAAMIASAALRLMRVRHLDVQALVFAIAGHAEAEYEHVREMTLDDMSAFAPVRDLLAVAHVQGHVRMFMN